MPSRPPLNNPGPHPPRIQVIAYLPYGVARQLFEIRTSRGCEHPAGMPGKAAAGKEELPTDYRRLSVLEAKFMEQPGYSKEYGLEAWTFNTSVVNGVQLNAIDSLLESSCALPFSRDQAVDALSNALVSLTQPASFDANKPSWGNVTVPLLATTFWAVMALCNFDVHKGHGHRTSSVIWFEMNNLASMALGGGLTRPKRDKGAFEWKAKVRAQKKFALKRRVGDVDEAIATHEAILDGCKFVLSLCRPGTDDHRSLPFWVAAVAKGQYRFDDETLRSCAMVEKKARKLDGTTQRFKAKDLLNLSWETNAEMNAVRKDLSAGLKKGKLFSRDPN